MSSLRTAYSSNRWVGLALDVVLVVVFAIAGRASHAESLTVTGVAGTAWPFVVACLFAWVSVTTLMRVPWHLVWPAGVTVWVVTVAGGLVLRVITGDTAAVPFIVVATLVLAVFLLVPRLVLGRRLPSPDEADHVASSAGDRSL